MSLFLAPTNLVWFSSGALDPSLCPSSATPTPSPYTAQGLSLLLSELSFSLSRRTMRLDEWGIVLERSAFDCCWSCRVISVAISCYLSVCDELVDATMGNIIPFVYYSVNFFQGLNWRIVSGPAFFSLNKEGLKYTYSWDNNLASNPQPLPTF